jgi:hypothetical protein
MTTPYRAKTLGGSSTMNAMIYTKPGREEMDGLFELHLYDYVTHVFLDYTQL